MTFNHAEFSDTPHRINISIETHVERGSEHAARVEEVIYEALRRYADDESVPNFAARAIAWDISRDA